MNGQFDSSDILKSALANPEMLAKAMSVAKELASSGALSGIMGNMQNDSVNSEKAAHDKPKNDFSEKDSECEKTPKPPKSDDITDKDRIRLLEALKPYVKPDKRDKLETVINLMGLLGTLKTKKSDA